MHVDGSPLSLFQFVDVFCKKMFTGIGVGRKGVFLSFILDKGCYGAARSGLDVESVKAYWVVGIKEVPDRSSASPCGWVVKY